jgi:hypothetical protein
VVAVSAFAFATVVSTFDGDCCNTETDDPTVLAEIDELPATAFSEVALVKDRIVVPRGFSCDSVLVWDLMSVREADTATAACVGTEWIALVTPDFAPAELNLLDWEPILADPPVDGEVNSFAESVATDESSAAEIWSFTVLELWSSLRECVPISSKVSSASFSRKPGDRSDETAVLLKILLFLFGGFFFCAIFEQDVLPQHFTTNWRCATLILAEAATPVPMRQKLYTKGIFR